MARQSQLSKERNSSPTNGNPVTTQSERTLVQQPYTDSPLSRPLELPRDWLALTLRECREHAGKSIYQLAKDSGVDAPNLWRMERGERQNITRETLILLSLGMVLDEKQVEQIVEYANSILDAAGLKTLTKSKIH